MAVNVFDHHDGVINQNTDRENQRKQRHAVQGIAHDIRRKQRHQDGHGDDHGDHDAFTPADGKQHQRDDRNCGQAQVKQQFIRLFIGGFTIVARDLNRDAFGDQLALHGLDPVQDFFGNDDGIGPGAFGNCQGHGGGAVDVARTVARHIGHDFVRSISDIRYIRHVAHIDRAPVAGCD